MAELQFFHHKIVHFILSGFMTVIYLFTIVWCLTLLCSLMALQSSADRQRNRFHGYREPQSVIVLFEGVFILILYVLLFGFILRNEENQQHTNYLINYVREAAVLIYNIVQLFMLFPLRYTFKYMHTISHNFCEMFMSFFLMIFYIRTIAVEPCRYYKRLFFKCNQFMMIHTF